MYDAAIGRWHVPDPLAEDYNSISPFHFSGNNPIRFLDLNGRNYDEFTVDLNNGEVNKVSNLGGDEVDIYHLGTSESDGTAFVLEETLAIERNENGGNINTFRIWESDQGTISAFNIPDTEISGVILEPSGESTSESNQDKRIPAGDYRLIKSQDREGAVEKNLSYPNDFVLYNEDVPAERGITIHSGNNPDQTTGCPMPGSTWGNNTTYGRNYVSGSATKKGKVNGFINSKGANNVTYKIHEKIKK